MLACWHRGELVHNAGRGLDYDQMPCMGMRRQSASTHARAAQRVCMMHFVVTKRLPGLAQLPSPLPGEAARALSRAHEFALTRDGLWLPVDPPRAGRDVEGRWMLVRGLSGCAGLSGCRVADNHSGRVQTFSHQDVMRYLDRLSGGAIMRRVESEARSCKQC